MRNFSSVLIVGLTVGLTVGQRFENFCSQYVGKICCTTNKI